MKTIFTKNDFTKNLFQKFCTAAHYIKRQSTWTKVAAVVLCFAMLAATMFTSDIRSTRADGGPEGDVIFNYP